jgi:filamentous hemagglutinin
MSTRKRISGDYTIQTINGSDSITLITSEAVIEGNLTVTGNAVLVGNINADRIFNGTSNVEIATPGGNVTVSVGGVSDVVDIGAAGAVISGAAIVTGNVTGANINTAGLITAAGNITAGNIDTAGNVLITGDSSVRQPTIRFDDSDTTVFPTQVIGAVEWFTNDATLGARVTSAIKSTYTAESGNAAVEIFTSTNGAAATAKVTVLSTGNVGVGNAAPVHLFSVNGTGYFGSTVTVVDTVTGGNLATAGTASAAGNITGGNLVTGGLATVTGNVTAGNVISLGAVSAGAGGILATGNITGGNVLSQGIISATGNLTTTDIFASSLSLSGNVISTLNASGVIAAGTHVDTPLLIATTIRSDDSVAVYFDDGITADGDITTQGSISAVGNITGNNVAAGTTVILATFADTTARDNAITSPASGMMIFIQDNGSAQPKFQGYITGTGWVDLN